MCLECVSIQCLILEATGSLESTLSESLRPQVSVLWNSPIAAQEFFPLQFAPPPPSPITAPPTQGDWGMSVISRV